MVRARNFFFCTEGSFGNLACLTQALISQPMIMSDKGEGGRAQENKLLVAKTISSSDNRADIVAASQIIQNQGYLNHFNGKIEPANAAKSDPSPHFL